jgi:hypothetical protein
LELRDKQKKKLEQMKPPKENIVLEMSAENDLSAMDRETSVRFN